MDHPENSSEYAGLQVNSGVEQPSIINPYLKHRRVQRRELSAADMVEGIVKGDVTILSQAQSLESSGSETFGQTQTPTQDIKPDTNIEIPINKSGGGAQTVGSVLGDAAASAVKGLMSKAASTDTKSQSTATGAKADCADGSCTTGNCTDGNCTDGNCTDCTVK